MSDELPSGEMKYSFKAHVQARGFAGNLIISSTTVNDLVKSIKLLGRASITPTANAQQTAAAVGQHRRAASQRAGKV
jgi:hypothetical protein